MNILKVIKYGMKISMLTEEENERKRRREYLEMNQTIDSMMNILLILNIYIYCKRS